MPNITYTIDKNTVNFTEESEIITSQWSYVIEQCRLKKLSEYERILLAFNTVDYVTSFDLPHRLLAIRAPQNIDKIRKNKLLYQKRIKINGQSRSVAYSHSDNLEAIPDKLNYTVDRLIARKYDSKRSYKLDEGFHRDTSLNARSNLCSWLKSGLTVTALDALLLLDLKRIATDIAKLRDNGMKIELTHEVVFDSLTGTTRKVPAYYLG